MTKQNCVNSSLTAHGIQVANATGVGCTSTTLTDGQLLIGSSGAAPVAATLSAGAGISITPGAGSLTITNTGGGGGIASVTGANGLEATTVFGAVTVGVKSNNATIATKGIFDLRSGDGALTSGDLIFNALAIGTDVNGNGEIYIQAAADGINGGNINFDASTSAGFVGGNIELNAVGNGNSSGNITGLTRCGDYTNSGSVQLRTKQTDVTSVKPAVMILDVGDDSAFNTPSDTSIRLRRSGEVSASVSDMDLRAGAITAYTGQMYINATGAVQPLVIDAPNNQFGTTTLVNGVKTVTLSWVTANNRIMVCYETPSGTVGHLGAVAGAGSFTITSYKPNTTVETSDQSTVQYWII